ncbi:MAG: site-specific DNA-methyltransferase, partial [Candidatus Caldatribacteriota bacterium]
MTEPKKLDLHSLDIVRQQKAKLRQLFPEVFTEDGIDFDRLKQTLGESIDTEKERYSMTWPGKSEAFQLIQ